jgi:hypothetical protein
MGPHATAGNPLAPPQPMSTMLKVKVAITKLSNVSIILHISICNDDDLLPEKTQRRGVCISSRILTCVWDFRCEIQLLEHFRAETDVGSRMVESGSLRIARNAI